MLIKLHYLNRSSSSGRAFFLNITEEDIERITDFENRRGILLKDGQYYTVEETTDYIFEKLQLTVA